MAVDPVLWLLPGLQHVSVTSLWFKLTTISASFIFFLILFVLSYINSHFFVKPFTEILHSKEKVYWCKSLVEFFFGFFAIISGVWFLFVEDELLNDLVSGSTFTSHVVLHIGVGYFIFDTMVLLASNIYYRFFNLALFVHHTTCLFGLNIPLVYSGKGVSLAIMSLFLEMPLPFLCMSWILQKCGMSNLWIWKANQFIVVHLFHCRTNFECYIYYKVFSQWENVWQNMPPELIRASVDALCRDGAGQISRERIQNSRVAPPRATIYASKIQRQRPQASL